MLKKSELPAAIASNQCLILILCLTIFPVRTVALRSNGSLAPTNLIVLIVNGKIHCFKPVNLWVPNRLWQQRCLPVR
ncbi:hypothetical protein [Laspinema olomoucense]|uniref:Secreted protein n=1 Tax=Laspinema olomoucense D3b TaxID=2953688 RepID=A0ABT2N547_9CYAN|nr:MULTISPECIES: hypothetical protein [unclassified Laspinema]MCT7973112.1 hypothetical protein [Laspinema sp. D3d]MCT7977812.1 hypothetical protein [Laspinema sp. D3b]MCT7989773.1 hypothetical protein [Laspinema sp. D3a]MCT7994173.1 hypothetical protein [Laspinema sp. D3c]